MIYLFNSSYRPLYRSNLIKTLYLPTGMINDYRYSFDGEVKNVHSDFLESIKSVKVGTPVSIIFVDRYSSEGYQYYPIRFGKYISYKTEGGRIFITAELTRFLSPSNNEKFNEDLKTALGKYGLPCLTNGDPDCPNDGNYAINADSIFSPEILYPEQNAWENIVKYLEKTKAFESSDQLKVLFMKITIQNSKNATVMPKVKNGESRFLVNPGQQLVLNYSYRYPYQLTNRDHFFEGNLIVTDSLIPIDGSMISINSIGNSDIKKIKVKNYPEDVFANIAFNFPEDIQGPKSEIKFQLIDTKWFWFLAAFSLLSYTLLGVITGLDISKISPLNFNTFIDNCWINLLAAALQSIALFVIIKLFGKKVF